MRETLDGPDGDTPHPSSWVAASRFPATAVSRDDGGWRVTAADDGPVFFGRRQEHLYARVRARLTVQGTGGLTLHIDPRHALDLEVSDGTVRAVWTVGDIRHPLGEHPVPEEAALELRILPSEGHEFSTARGPDRIVAGIVGDAGFAELGVDGRYLSTEVAGGMTGRVVGVVSTRGHVLLRSFEYLGADDPAALGAGPAGFQRWTA
ncbi:hypothetical protein J7F02_19305 [Streptomyces sp. ISL-112]|uniref:beta-xylosidase family glycoside hydrolase n=1 Tax=unclassified Streptomyces TaxID=2593676 RepID=UPI001BE61D3E|nr:MULTISPECIES: hypothetical protein [unclassified Streptomyces]MBT2427756.1 hypothetical protein [Streptomyces sp. ISL-112]MBT2464537.1 hypothetical protein [Streptomyces sp. ISL-63]